MLTAVALEVAAVTREHPVLALCAFAVARVLRSVERAIPYCASIIRALKSR